MKYLLTATVALVVGIAGGYFLPRDRFPYAYDATRPLSVVDRNGKPAGTLPAGTRLASAERLLNSADLGWRAYVPVQFDTMKDARDCGVRPGHKIASSTDVTLFVFPQ